jgi:hypothetical protein
MKSEKGTYKVKINMLISWVHGVPVQYVPKIAFQIRSNLVRIRILRSIILTQAGAYPGGMHRMHVYPPSPPVHPPPGHVHPPSPA